MGDSPSARAIVLNRLKQRFDIDSDHINRIYDRLDELDAELCTSRQLADRYKAALEDIRDIAFDGDGLATAEDLGKDIAELAKAALQSHTPPRGEEGFYD